MEPCRINLPVETSYYSTRVSDHKFEVLSQRSFFSSTEGSSSGSQLKFADVSRGLQNIFTQAKRPLSVAEVEAAFTAKFQTTIQKIAGVSTLEYIRRKDNVFSLDEEKLEVYLQPQILAGPPIPDPAIPKDENFVVQEFERLIEDSGPVCYISSLCGKFIQRNGVSVTSITDARPLDVFKRHPDVFLLVGGGNVTLRKLEWAPQVQKAIHAHNSKVHRVTKKEDVPSVPDVITVDEVVQEFRRLILQDRAEQVYISSLCGRFLQRFKVPVTNIINCRPADFLRKYDDIFVMTGGGNVGLREVLGDDAKSVPPPPPREERARLLCKTLTEEELERIQISDEVLELIVGACPRQLHYQAERVVDELRMMLDETYLAVESLVIGGSVGKDMVFHECTDVELHIFVLKLPVMGQTKWQSYVMDILECVLQLTVEGAKDFKSDEFVLRFTLHNVPVTMRITPVFETDQQGQDSHRSAALEERCFLAPSSIRENVNFIRKQPAAVKTALKLMRWWKRQQQWSGAECTPSDDLIESIVIRAAQNVASSSAWHIIDEALCVMQNPVDIMALRAEMGSESSSQEESSSLFSLPTDDSTSFDCEELMEFSRKPHALNAFRRQASRIPQVYNGFINVGKEDADEGLVQV